MPFDSIFGHKVPIRILRSMLKTGQLPHAFIFSGVDGIGKRTTAVCFVKALNCHEMEDDFCDRCPSCQKVERLTHPDLFCIEPEKNVIKIEQVRALQQEIVFKPMEGKKKAVIIDQAEKINLQAANCLLKTLEEPPEDTVLILAARSTAGMLPTVLSRCHRIVFSPLGDEDILQFLRKEGYEEDRAKLVIPHAQGSIKRVIFLLESDFLTKWSETAEILSSDPTGNLEAVLNLSKRLSDDSEGLTLVLEFLQVWYRDLLLLKEGLSESLLYNRDIIDSVREAAGHETRDGIIRKIKRIQWMQNNALLNLDIQLGLESVFLQVS